jgi:hypothetical protein
MSIDIHIKIPCKVEKKIQQRTTKKWCLYLAYKLVEYIGEYMAMQDF